MYLNTAFQHVAAGTGALAPWLALQVMPAAAQKATTFRSCRKQGFLCWRPCAKGTHCLVGVAGYRQHCLVGMHVGMLKLFRTTQEFFAASMAELVIVSGMCGQMCTYVKSGIRGACFVYEELDFPAGTIALAVGAPVPAPVQILHG